MRKKTELIPNKEQVCDDWCFSCKDGGDLIICEHENCLKTYHNDADCVKPSLLKAKKFKCERHKCSDCRRPSDYQCYGCPKALCGRCIKTAYEEFVQVRGKKGFCRHCLKLSLLVEENKDVDSDGEKVDFNDLDNYETLYKEYWEIINDDEKLTLEDLISAKARLKSGKNYDSDNYDDNSDDYQVSDFEDKDDIDSRGRERKRKRNEAQPSRTIGKTKSNKKEFIGWGSKSLMQFLTAIGKDTTDSLTQWELEKIIKGYIKEHKLPQKKRIVECDPRLQSVFGRKTVKLNKIHDLLESHLAENQEPSDEELLGYELEDKDVDDENLVVRKRKKKDNADKMLEKEKAVLNVPRFHFADIVPENIRLVYLRRTLVQKLAEEPETFDSKVIGSFVKVRADTNGFFLRNTYQLVQVTGIKKCLVGENDQNLVLQASDMDICINALSDDDFSEEECQDLRSKVKAGILKKLTVVALEQKARSLHEDITKHWIPRELALLKHRIDQANEKGWRRELFEYLDRREYLKNSSNQLMLLQKVPTVVPDIEEVGPIEEDIEDDQKGNKDSPESSLMHMSEISCEMSKGNESRPEGGKDDGHASIPGESTPKTEGFTMEGNFSKCSNALAPGKQKNSKPAVAKDDTHHCNPSPADVDQGSEKSQRLIDLSSDDDGEKPIIPISKEDLEDIDSCRWYAISSDRGKVGPLSLSELKSFSMNLDVASKCKIYKIGQSEEQAMPLVAMMSLAFPRR